MWFEITLAASAWALGHFGSGHWISEALQRTHQLFGSKSPNLGGSAIDKPAGTLSQTDIRPKKK